MKAPATYASHMSWSGMRGEPHTLSLRAAAAQSRDCRRCDLPAAFGEMAALVTIHPSWLPRMPDPAMKARERERFADDLKPSAGLAQVAA
jgi:hypothetical protein